MPTQWAIDFGTTNSVVARAEEGSVQLARIPEIGRALPTEQFPLIPTAIHVSDTWQRFLWLFRRRRREVLIGQMAVARNFDGRAPGYAQGFKRYLGGESHRTIARCGESEISVRHAAQLFLGELLEHVEREFHVRPEDLTIPAPVGFYDNYRAELQQIARGLGVKRFRSLDEPVAAALGYGINVSRDEMLLVFDFGGGTLNLAVIQLGGETAQTGAAPVVAKHMIPVGGEDVDRWIMNELVPGGIEDLPTWHNDLRWEAMYLKERVSRDGVGEFRWGGIQRTFTREELIRLMDRNRLFEMIRTGLGEISRELESQFGGRGIDQVLMTGGSTLLPEIPAVVDEFFPRSVVRQDHQFVFTSVAQGAARFAGGVAVEDFVYHDYAIAVQNQHTHSVEYELLVPRRTRYPTSDSFAVRYYADFPGMSEMRFSVCEVGRLGQAPVPWTPRPNSNRYWAPRTEEERALVLELNPADAPIPLRPVGQGHSPRLKVTYFINADRWLCTTVEDLVRKQPLRVNEPVIRLR